MIKHNIRVFILNWQKQTKNIALKKASKYDLMIVKKQHIPGDMCHNWKHNNFVQVDIRNRLCIFGKMSSYFKKR